MTTPIPKNIYSPEYLNKKA